MSLLFVSWITRFASAGRVCLARGERDAPSASLGSQSRLLAHGTPPQPPLPPPGRRPPSLCPLVAPLPRNVTVIVTITVKRAVIFYAALGSWTFGAFRLADMFESKTREQDTAAAVRRTRGGHRSGSWGSSAEEKAEGSRFPLYKPARPAGRGLLHRRIHSRDSPA